MDDKPLVLSIGPIDGDPVRCEVESMDDVSARIRVPAHHGLPEMSSVALWLSGDTTGTSVVLPAYTGWPEQDGEDLVCDVYFAHPNALSGYQEDGADRRSTVRVAPAPDEVELWLNSDRPGVTDPVECLVVDLGEGGMCIELTVGLEPTTPFTSAQFQLLLPGHQWPLVLQAQVRHRTRISREVVRYGLEFDHARSLCFDHQRAQIAAFVEERVAQIARRMKPEVIREPAAPDPQETEPRAAEEPEPESIP